MDLLALILTPAVLNFTLGYWLGWRHRGWVDGGVIRRGIKTGG